MKFFAVVLLFAAAAMAIEEPIAILRSDVHRHDDGHYSFDVEGADGTIVSQQGSLQDGEEGKVVVVKGSFSYIGDDGIKYTVTYTADDKGFHPHASHLPVAPIDYHH